MVSMRLPQTISSEKSTANALSNSVDDLRTAVQQIPPALLAQHTGTCFSETGPDVGEFSLRYFDMPVVLSYPDLIAYNNKTEVLPLPTQALLLYHFNASNGMPLTGKWVSFADLPEGLMYARAFQGYSGDKLVRIFGNEIEAVKLAGIAAGGLPCAVGDVSFSFMALPRVPLLVTYWAGEDEFPASAKILFDSSARNYLPIDVCAMLGSTLVSRIIKSAARAK
jgi:hypothetical protein